jgi:hypothetical protein
MRLSNEQVLKQWVEDYLPSVVATYEKDGHPDMPARRESIGELLDYLCKSNMITQDQYNSIDIDEYRLELN